MCIEGKSSGNDVELEKNDDFCKENVIKITAFHSLLLILMGVSMVRLIK